MSISLLHGCFHIELAVRDIDTARAFMVDALGAAPIEQGFARDLQALVPDDYGIDHLDCGQATFQLNQPSPSMGQRGIRSIHQRYLDDVGPCVTNLNFYVDDIAHAGELLGDLGAATHMRGPSTMARALADYGDANTRAGGNDRPFLFLGSRHLVGLDLEVMEPNFLRFVDQAAQQPCYVGPRTGDASLRLQRLVLAVDDLEATYANLTRVLSPGSRSNPYDLGESPSARWFRITIGGIELEYCGPRTAAGPLTTRLSQFGPGVVTAVFSALDPDAALTRAAAASAEVTAATDLLGVAHTQPRWQLASRDQIGFDVVIEAVDEHALAGTR